MSALRNKFIENSKADQAFCERFAKQKNGLDYIPWARMWSTAMGRYDRVIVGDTVRRDAEGVSVEVSVILGLGDENSETVYTILAVTDGRNKPIVEPTSADVQNTRQRALAKALSMATGIGLSLWFGAL